MSRPCTHWASFKCNFGDRCQFSHDGPGGPSPLGEFPGAGQGGAPQQAVQQGFGGGGGGGRPCQHWANFKCNFGDRCQFSHDGPGGPSPLGEYTGKGGGGGGGGNFQQAGGDGATGGQPSDNVFVSQLPSGLNEDLVNQLFSQYGTVTSVKIVSKPDQDGTAALVRFATEAEAAFIVEGMNGNIPQGLTTPVQTRFAGAAGGGKGGGGGVGVVGAGFPGGIDRSAPYPQTAPQSTGKGLGKPGDTPMEQIVRGLEESGGLPGGDGRDKSQMIEVFVFGLPHDTTDLHLYRMFAPFGQIAPKGANVMTDNGGCKGFGFVNFLAVESAQLSIQTLNGAILPNKRVLKVEIKAAGKGGGSKGFN